MKELYEFLKKWHLTTPKEISKFCEDVKIEEVLETSMEAFIITQKARNKAIPGSLFNFSASCTLSGGNYPCEAISCRINHIAELAKFSSIYSDSTTIYNPFDFVYFAFNSSSKQQITPHTIRLEALNAFSITLEFKPLVERGLINFSKTIYVICTKCKKKKDKIINSIIDELEKIAEKTLFPLFKKSVEIEYEKDSFHLRGIETLIGEDFYFHYEKFPNYLIKNRKRINSIKDLQYDNPLIQKIITEAINSLMIQKIDNLENLTQTYLTTNMMEKTLLESMGKQVDNTALNFFAKGLPIIENMPYERIVEMRDVYSDQFKSFQNLVYDLMNKAKKF